MDPSDYCINLNSISTYLSNVYQHEMGQSDMNQEHNIRLDQFPFVSQDEIFDIVAQKESWSALDNNNEPYID